MDGYDDREEWPPEELKAEFAVLFPTGWAGPDVMAELAPDGWAASPLLPLFHPSAEQLFQEALTVHRNMALLPRRPDAPPPPPEPTRDQFPDDDAPPELEPARECQELVGRCLWDIFSDAHEVISADGRLLSLGSSRGSGGFLADVLNAQGGPPPPPRPEIPEELTAKMFPPTDDPQMAAFLTEMRKEMFGDGGYTYLDFYMGTGMVSGRADLTPVYALIFRRLRARGHDWVYHFPRLYAVDFRPLKKALDEQNRDEPEFAGYDPSAAFEAEAEDRRKDEELAEFRERLDEGHREAVEASRGTEPPATVRAYAAVYGHWPKGWPPEA